MNLDSELSDLGLRITDATRSADGVTLTVDTSDLRARLGRFEAAVAELHAAWEALPVGARERFDGSTLTLHAQPATLRDDDLARRGTTFRAYVIRLSASPPFWYVGKNTANPPEYQYRAEEGLRSAHLFGDPGPAKRVMTALFADRAYATIVPVDVTLQPHPS